MAVAPPALYFCFFRTVSVADTLLSMGVGHQLASPTELPEGRGHIVPVGRRHRQCMQPVPTHCLLNNWAHEDMSKSMDGFLSHRLSLGKPHGGLLRSATGGVGEATWPGLLQGRDSLAQCSGWNRGSGKVTFPVAVIG